MTGRRAERLTLEHHEGGPTDSHRCDFSNVKKCRDSELANAETHDNASDDNDSFMICIRYLGNTAE